MKLSIKNLEQNNSPVQKPESGSRLYELNMKKLLYLMLIICTLVSLSCSAARISDQQQLTYLDQLPPLLDRELFFDDAEVDGARLSPDGKSIMFRQRYNGVMNIWVKSIDEPFEKARPMTADQRPVHGFFWSRDSRLILYVQDQDGDENYNLYAVNPADEPDPKTGLPEPKIITEYQGVQTRILSVPREDQEHIIIGINERDPSLHDAYQVNLRTGKRELVFKNKHNITGWTFDDYGKLRFVSRQTPDGGSEILQVKDDELKRVYQVDFGETARISRFCKDNERVYMVTNKGADVDLTRLVIFEPETGHKELVEKDPEGEVDFGGAIFSDISHELLATTYVGDKARIYFHNQQFQKDYEKIRARIPEGDIHFRARSADENTWLIVVSRDVDPGSVYIFDRKAQDVTLLYRSRPDLPSEHLAHMEPVRYSSRDGLSIPGYLTLPRGPEPKNLALVVLPHGGPWVRDTWGYDPQVQFLANRGYAVLQPNFRGSSGFGKSFLNSGNQQWGTGYMQHDITDGVKYLIDKGLVDPQRVGIYGTSYGGFAALSGLAFTPDLYQAGISNVGPSNIITLIESVPPYWLPAIKSFHLRVGDPDDPEDRARLKNQSPLFSAAQIKAPLLVVQGANDPRVIQRESDQIVDVLREKGRQVYYLVAPDEGHGFTARENRLAFFVKMERFFAQHLGGRYQKGVASDIQQRLKEITVYPE
ncbi:S9 family peptidase [Desulfonatronovibrio hydrogenovorans]|uniref:S9 family peptidase n=1 Tax=Desulfonatronovibrio hydrogenovorans TaxID=53245 RepID=UPI000B172338|nr:S9 family peptidase [Desulfonatronovibrio hydrogenovorans]